jgi:transposase InsO family protein
MLRTSRGGEFTSTTFNEYCQKFGIKRWLTQALTPQQNGVTERRNRTIMERARSMAISYGIPTFIWSKVVNTSNYLVDRGPTCANNDIVLEQRYSKHKSHFNHLRVFGCLAYVHVPKQDCDKLGSKTKKCLFMGYDDKSKVYKLYDPKKKNII